MKIPRIPSTIALWIIGATLAILAILIVGDTLYNGGIWHFITLIATAAVWVYLYSCAFPEDE